MVSGFWFHVSGCFRLAEPEAWNRKPETGNSFLTRNWKPGTRNRKLFSYRFVNLFLNTCPVVAGNEFQVVLVGMDAVG